MQLIRLITLYAALVVIGAMVLSIFLEPLHPEYLVAVTDWSFEVFGQQVGPVGYSQYNGNRYLMVTMLHMGPLELTLAEADIYCVLPAFTAMTTLFFVAGFLVMRRDTFAMWLETSVTLRNVAVCVAFLLLAGAAAASYRFAEPRQWRTIHRGMTRDTVHQTMPDLVIDEMDTAKSDCVMRQRVLFGIRRWWMMRITYADGGVATAEKAYVDPDKGDLRDSPWMKVTLE